MLYITGVLAFALAVIHLIGDRLRFLDTSYRSVWLSVAGGASVAYVFVHILPDLSRGQRVVEQIGILQVPYLEQHVYIFALIGLTVFYGLERAAKMSRRRRGDTSGIDPRIRRIFWVRTSSFALYNLLIGYLLVHRDVPGISGLMLFWVAMSLHFVTNDYALRKDDMEDYHNYGRWILGAGVLAGWALGAATRLNVLAVELLFSFLAGGILLNVLKEELPDEKESRFWAFALGAAVYAAVLLLI